MKINFFGIFNRIVATIFGVMMFVIILVLVIGVIEMFADIRDMFMEHRLKAGYSEIIYDVLTLFVMIELLRSIVEYFNTRRLRMTFIVDAALVFVLREVMIKIFEQKIAPEEMYGMSALILVLTVLRIGSALLHQRDIKLEQSQPASY